MGHRHVVRVLLIGRGLIRVEIERTQRPFLDDSDIRLELGPVALAILSLFRIIFSTGIVLLVCFRALLLPRCGLLFALALFAGAVGVCGLLLLVPLEEDLKCDAYVAADQVEIFIES